MPQRRKDTIVPIDTVIEISMDSVKHVNRKQKLS
jgi:hypothetical protein